MVKEWHEIEKLVMKVLVTEFKVNPRTMRDSELYSESYIGYDKACRTFNPDKGQFNTYCMVVIRWHLYDYLKYHTKLIHVPVAKKETEIIDTISLYDQNDRGVELIDMFESTIDFSDDTMLRNYFLNSIDSMIPHKTGYLKKALIALRNNIDTDEKLDNSVHRHYYALAKKILKEKYNRDVENGII